MKKKNRFVCSVCFKAPPVSLTACHFRQIFRSVTFLQKMESQHTLRIKWFHIIFHRLVFLHSNSAAAGLRLLLLLCKKNKDGSSGSDVHCRHWGNITPDLWDWDVNLQTGIISHCMAFVKEVYVQGPSMYITCYCQCESILFLISTWLLCILFYFFFNVLFLLRRSFNISSIKAKRAVNRMHCVVQIVIGGLFKSPRGDIKAMQIASLS